MTRLEATTAYEELLDACLSVQAYLVTCAKQGTPNLQAKLAAAIRSAGEVPVSDE